MKSFFAIPLSRLSTSFPALHKLISGNSTAFRVVKNFGWISSEQILGMIASLLVGVWTARYLGPEQFGLLSYALAFTSLFAAIVPLGLNNLIVRDIVQEPENRQTTLGTAFFMQLTAGVVVIGLIAIVSTWWLDLEDESQTRQLIFILSLISLIHPVMTLNSWFQSQLKAKYATIASLISLAFVVLTRVFLLVFQAPLSAFAVVLTLERVINASALLYFYVHSGESIRKWRVNLVVANKLFREGLPYLLSGIAVLIYMRIDQIMLREMVGDRESGLYTAAGFRRSGILFLLQLLHQYFLCYLKHELITFNSITRCSLCCFA
jgi:PST family polysaccharide transporter